MKTLPGILLTITAAGIMGGCNLFAKKPAANVDKTTTTAAYDLRNNMRKLWEDKNTWTKNVVDGTSANMPGTEQAMTRLYKNQDDIVNAIVVYYSDASPKLTDLLHEHVKLTADMLKGSKGKKKKGSSSEDLEKKWDDNAAAIADYFGKANPTVKTDNLKNTVQDYMKLTKDLVQNRMKRDYEAEVTSYDKVHDASLSMADSISMGIIRQFPDKF